MSDFEKAIRELGKIAECYRGYDGGGAVPMPLKTVTEAYDALMFEKNVTDLVHGFEVDKDRAIARINRAVEENDLEVIRTMESVFVTVLSRYFDTKKGRYHHGKRF